MMSHVTTVIDVQLGEIISVIGCIQICVYLHGPKFSLHYWPGNFFFFFWTYYIGNG